MTEELATCQSHSQQSEISKSPEKPLTDANCCKCGKLVSSVSRAARGLDVYNATTGALDQNGPGLTR